MNPSDKIPLVDLHLQYLGIKDEIDKAVLKCISESNFIKGDVVSEFESEFSKYIGTKYCIGCGNGTDALELILKSLMIGRDDEVIVPALTWIATAEAINNVGAEPVFVDINPESYTIDIKKIEEKISKKTKAIIPVHLYGCPAEMDELEALAKRHNLYIVEDCAQAHGAEYNGKKIGTFGIASAFSFFPSKNLGAFGDAGAIVTNDEILADSVRRLSNHGQLQRHAHSVIGRNSRLDSIQAAVLSVKLPYLDKWNHNRRNAADHYSSILRNINGLILPNVTPNRKSVYHLFVIQSEIREVLMQNLKNHGIASAVHYPKPLPFLEAYSYKNHIDEDFPIALKMSSLILSLPMYPEISDSQINFVCQTISDVYGKFKKDQVYLSPF